MKLKKCIPKRIVVVIEQRRKHIKHTKESKYLTSCAHTRTRTNTHAHTRETPKHTYIRTHACTHARKHALGINSLNYNYVRIKKKVFAQKWHNTSFSHD